MNGGVDPVPGEAFTLSFGLEAEGLAGEQVLGIVLELSGLPGDTVVKTRPVEENCALENLAAGDDPVAYNIIMDRPRPLILDEGELTARCNPAVGKPGRPLEFLILGNNPNGDLSEVFPFEFSLTLEYPSDAPLVESVEVVYEYRVGTGPEITNSDFPEVILFGVQSSGCASTQGDADGSGSVTPGDAQQAFEYFLGVTQNLAVSCVQCDGDAGGQITPGDAQAIFDVFLGARPICDGSNAPIDDTPEN
jgi:hypothetical protein